MKNSFRNASQEEAKKSKTITFVHHKGGTGKTTACLNVAGWLTKMGKKVLAIDLDAQGNLTTGLGIDRHTLDGTMYEVLFGKTLLEDVIVESDSGIYLAPSSIDLLAAETHMASSNGFDTTRILKDKIAHVGSMFDYVLIDVPPGSALLMINGLVASENIIIPLDSGVFSYETLETLKHLIIDLQDELHVEINVMMIILRKFSNSWLSFRPTHEVEKLLKEFLHNHHMDEVSIYKVPFSRKIYKAQKMGRPISHYAPFSGIGRAYKKIAEEIVQYG